MVQQEVLVKTSDMNLKPSEQEVKLPDYDEKEKDYIGFIIRRLTHSLNQRAQKYTELNDQTVDEYYLSNKKAGNGYMPPKKNRQDVRTVSGVTREKKNTIVSSLLNYNFEPDVEAYDEYDMPVVELGTNMEDMIKKSRRIEAPDHEAKKIHYYNELAEQGTIFVWERATDYRVLKKTLQSKMSMDKLSSIKWTSRVERLEKVLETELLTMSQVFLGNIKEFFLELQPYVVIRKVRTRVDAGSIYGAWERWKNVPYKMHRLNPQVEVFAGGELLTYDNWSMLEVEQDLVEEIWYMDKWNNELQIILNGVMMMPVGFPLSELIGESEYPLAKGDVEPIDRYFAYSRSIPAKTKINQAIFDEMLRAIVLKTRKSYQPPIANMTGQTLSPKIWYPATIHDNVDASKIEEIGTNTGVTASEMSAFELIKSVIDQNSVTPIFEGQASGGSQTAREIVELKQQSLMRLGMIILGVVNLERKLAWLRLKNILKYWSEPIVTDFEETKEKIVKTVNVYRKESVDTTLEDGNEGVRMIQFTDKKELPHPDQVMAEEELLTKKMGKSVRKTYINADVFKNLKYKWYINITPQPKDTNELKAAVFMENVTQGIQLFGPDKFNMEFLLEQWAVLNKLNPEKALKKDTGAEMDQLMQALQMKGGGQQPIPTEGLQAGPVNKQLMPRPLAKPSVNTMMGAS